MGIFIAFWKHVGASLVVARCLKQVGTRPTPYIYQRKPCFIYNETLEGCPYKVVNSQSILLILQLSFLHRRFILCEIAQTELN